MELPIKTIRVATAFIIDENNQVLLLKRNERSYRGYWQFPEGKISGNETPRTTLARELKEEIGVNIKIIAKLGNFPLTSKLHGISLTALRFVYKTEKPKKVKLSSEHSEFGWFKPSDALKLKLAPGVKEILAQYMVEREM